MITINGVTCETIGQLETLIADLDEYQKQCLRNDFNGIPNEPIVGITKIVSPRQIRIALLSRGITLSMIDQAIDQLEEPTKSAAKIIWEYALEYHRDDQLVSMFGQMLGFSNADLDELWNEAASL
jgi:hypothetical protein